MIINEYLQRRYRVAIDLTPLISTGENGGVNVFSHFLLESLAKLAPHWDIILLTSSNNHGYLTETYQKRVKTYCLKPQIHHANRIVTYSVKLWHFVRLVMGWNRILHQLKVDLLLCPYTNPALQESGIPTITIVHDLQHLAMPQAFSWQEWLYRQLFFYQLTHRSTHIVCISEFTRQSMSQAFPNSKPKLQVIHHGNYRAKGVPQITEIQKVLIKYGLEQNKCFFYPANNWPHKNHRTLLKAFSQYHQHSQNPIDLVLTGAWLQPSCLSSEEEKIYRSHPQIHVLGYVEAQTLESLWQGCFCLLFPSRYEGFGMPLVEAMYYHKPILCSQAASLPEVAGDAALYFHPDDVDDLVQKLLAIQTDTELVHELIAKGQQRLRLFSPTVTAQQYIQLICTTLAALGDDV